MKGVQTMYAGRESSYFLVNDGKVKACGRNDEGQLGDGTYEDTTVGGKTIVDVILSKPINRLGSGPSSQSVFFIGEDEVYAAGINDRYQLGVNDIGSRPEPVKVEFDGKVDIEFISASGTHTVARGRPL